SVRYVPAQEEEFLPGGPCRKPAGFPATDADAVKDGKIGFDRASAKSMRHGRRVAVKARSPARILFSCCRLTPISLLHFPEKFNELNGLFRIGKHILAARKPVVHIVQTAFNHHPPPTRQTTTSDAKLSEHC
ncbi:MAG: hypothetical protein ACC742_05850, partial [Thermoanaerobaculales bacterium]